MPEFHFYNIYHYGDNILNLKFLNNISSYLEKYDITIHYYYNDEYIKNRGELEQYIHTPRIKINIISNIPHNAIQLWMGNDINNVNHINFDLYYNLFYRNILHILKIQDNINTSLYQDEIYLEDRYNLLNRKYNNKYKDLDILILNSYPKSYQYEYNKEEFDKLCINLNEKYKICVTENVDNSNIVCTRDNMLKIQDIGAISTRAKYIIVIHSGPITACYNSLTQKNIKKWFIFGNSKLVHNEIDALLNPNFDTIYSYFLKNT